MLELTIPLVLFLFPLAYSPGPGNLFFAANGARFGVRDTIQANAGYHFATLAVTLAIGFGFTMAIAQAPESFVAIQWAGSFYVLWLAYKFLRAGTAANNETARPAGFVDGIILLVLNPKAYVIITLMFTQFLVGANLDHTVAVVWISVVFTANNFLAFLIWTLVGNQITRRFRSDVDARRLNTFFGVLLAGVAIWMLLG